MVNIPTDVIFDETIQRYGLDGYDVLFLVKCDTLLKSVYDAIVKFQAEGGIVVADQYLRAPIEVNKRFDFDFTYRNKVSANAIIDQKDYAGGGDTLADRTSKIADVKGVTALEDQEMMERFARELESGLDGLVKHDIDCSSLTALTNMLERGSARYLFVINDKRTYDSRFGEYQAILERTVHQEVGITLHNWQSKNLYAYDMVAKKNLALSKEGDAYKFKVNLQEAGGTIVALLPCDISKVEIEVPQKIFKGAGAVSVQIAIKSSANELVAGAQPIRVAITDPAGNVSEYSDYYCAIDGVFNLNYVPAQNDIAGKWQVQVEELISGKMRMVSFTMVDKK